MIAVTALGLSGCNFAPPYSVPTSPIAPSDQAYKADPMWKTAAPADDVAKGAWWTLFGDPVLDALEAKVAVTNQNVAYYRALYRENRATVDANRAALFPTVSASADYTRSGAIGKSGGTSGVNPGTGTTSKGASVTGSASWEPDLWGKLRNTVGQSRAQAQASAADLANATLSAQATLATDYLSLRAIDARAVMLDDTIAAYRKALEVTRNKFRAQTITEADVASAQSTLSTALASRRDLDRQRAAYENEIAMLVGENPSHFTLPVAQWNPVVPKVPSILPSQILQRRPDIASAERAVAAANANIGIQKAAFFPDLTLSGSAGSSASSIGKLFSAATSFWSLGADAALTLLDFGARSAKVRNARAAYDAAVASYRQSVLNAFQEVETDLAAVAAYNAEQPDYAQAQASAMRAEQIARNEYTAGTVDYTTVSAAQATNYNARIDLITNVLNQQTAAVSLIEAIGGHWQDDPALLQPALPSTNGK
ncbi:RND transporter [Novosphingobium sp. Leaf2]|nr:RND transporter [Novosphingobium sp. Leaf2]